ncbi:endonuclease domain-containing protein [Prevotella sp. E13-17]|uniref:endonuclease domain-containing protein n=1 Tax=Prevotella sp. E13-17 TaxID=2913616 RepID=UPI001ED9EA4A|nr:endonuclease domain-containing protein [Prevotella sp. E13-17]UKK51746.1 endonuclease domain-containing protein [Prevotella sp. E13-17]
MGYHYETAAPDRYELLKDFAKKNRGEMTESERVLWEALRKLNCGYHFRRQHPIGDYIADFICIKKMLVIEVDGGYHNEPRQLQDDLNRTEFLESKGFTVIRFKNEEIGNDLKTVIIRIKELLFNE